MKKILLSAGALAMAFAACQTQPQGFELSSTVMPEELNGQYVYVGMRGEDEKLDSVLIENRSFKYTSNVDTVNVFYVRFGGYALPIFKDQTKAVIVEDSTDMNGSGFTVKGSRLYDRFTEMNNEIAEAITPLREEAQALYQDTEKTMEEKQAAIENYMAQMAEKQNTVAHKYLEIEKNNVIGVIAFSNISFEEDSQYLAVYENASDIIKNNANLKDRYENLKNAEKTQVGADYIDFDIKDAEGNVTKLSSFMGEGKYLLVDFWASWCGPCRRAMPHLADLHKTYADKGLRVLSIGTWERDPADNAKAIEELEVMTWDVILDTESNGAKVYGLTGIPSLLLISPEGKILVRTHNPEDVDAVIKEVIK